MRLLFAFFILFLVVGANANTLAVRDYDAGAFVIRYKAPAQVDPVFTRIYRSATDRADGAVYITADPPGGIARTKPGTSLGIFVLPADRFGPATARETELASSLPDRLHASHPDEKFLATLRVVGARTWVEITSYSSDAVALITSVVCYSYLDSEHVLYTSWNFGSRISKKKFEAGQPARFEILAGFEVLKEKAAQSSQAATSRH